ncbi:flagellar biosynthetic protein FliR [Sphingomonas sp. AP4-R1]|uniref:flagellar biosynthetic protein FliR n=1 Tax=Sphingomonas sp. AP4-R1 TaxID=2735134 RepID=UPI0014934C7F|nr:flagellar biosynthetic protein FliR [Sphingomonas sp. AP4-R1]QJU57417.1 flagellar biosynthetic protein FliR [Sphingomonas sp. AP4-R1]
MSGSAFALIGLLPVDAATFLILFARIGAVAMLLPAFSEEAIPPQIRLLLGLGFALGLYGLLHGKVAGVVAPHAGAGLIAITVAEIMTGLAIGMLVRIFFQAAAMAGSIASMQIGLSSALVFDPAMGGQLPLLARFTNVAAAVVCLSLGLHHLWIAAIVHSYASFPVGGLPPAADFAQLAVMTTGRAMALAVSMAAPLLLYGIVFNVALGLAARIAPAIQIFFITQPLNILLGLSLFAAVIGTALYGFATAMGAFLQSSGLV